MDEIKNSIFERSEIKYVLSLKQYESIIDEILNHFKVDEYNETTIQSLYFDTDNYEIIRRSIEGPIYKEKLRLRSYGLSKEYDKVFFELKKKYNGIVYKRRTKILFKDALNLLEDKYIKKNQIEKEISYFKDIYKNLKPKVLIMYDRTALEGIDNEMRITFDRNTRFREFDLNLHTSLDGELLFNNNEIIMEVKTLSSYPLWFSRLLSENNIYKSSFSKYGTVYTKYIANKENINV